MDTKIAIRTRAAEIAASVKDVNSDNIIFVADMIAKYIIGSASIPESLDMKDFIKSVTDATVSAYDSSVKKQCPELLGGSIHSWYGVGK